MRIVTSILCLIALGACAMRAPLTRVAIEQNALVAKSTDEMVLLNIARAYEREPMHFTSISALHGNVSLSAETGVGGSFAARSILRAPNAAGAVIDSLTIPGDSWTPSLKGTVSTNPSFDLAINDSQEFYQGFLAPIEPGIVAHYLDDGWPAELITYLLARRFDFVASHTVLRDGFRPLDSDLAEAARTKRRQREPGYQPAIVERGTVLGSLVNDGDVTNVQRFRALGDFVHCFHLAATSVTEADHVLAPLDRLGNIASFDKLDGASFDIVNREEDGRQVPMLVRKGRSSDSLKLVDVVNEGRRTQREPKSTDAACDLFRSPSPGNFSYRFDRTGEASGRRSEPDRLIGTNGVFTISTIVDGRSRTIDVPVDVTITLRSPEALIYFLGEYSRYEGQARFETDVGKPVPPACAKSGTVRPLAPIFVMHKVDAPAKALLSVRLDGAAYVVPDPARECIGRTMQVLGLVEQLVNLHKNSRDKIGTTSVRLIQ